MLCLYGQLQQINMKGWEAQLHMSATPLVAALGLLPAQQQRLWGVHSPFPPLRMAGHTLWGQAASLPQHMPMLRHTRNVTG